jgi:hypothetical protein
MAAVAAPSVAMTPDLKRLAFVENAAVTSLSYVTDSSIFAKACGYYSSAKETNALKVRNGARTRRRGAALSLSLPLIVFRCCHEGAAPFIFSGDARRE